LIGTEQLNVQAMTCRSKKNVDVVTGEAPANGAAAKAGKNRGILDAAPSMLLRMLKTKAEEAGTCFAQAHTRKLKPTQRCHHRGNVVKKLL
jgi:putative transposase